MRVEFNIHGTPQPQGSAKSFIPKGWKRAVITTANPGLKSWRQDISITALQAMGEMEPMLGPVMVEATFYFAKPKSTSKKVVFKITKPDVDKTLRGLLDGLSGIVFRDDAQVVQCKISKSFRDQEGTHVIVQTV